MKFLYPKLDKIVQKRLEDIYRSHRSDYIHRHVYSHIRLDSPYRS